MNSESKDPSLPVAEKVQTSLAVKVIETNVKKLAVNDSAVRIFAFMNIVVALCFLIPGTTVFVVPIVMFLMFVISLMLYAVQDPLSAMASLATTGMFIWYFILVFTNRAVINDMPQSWVTFNVLIGLITAVHCLLIVLGRKFFQFTWITMAGLVFLLTIQHGELVDGVE